MESYSKAIHRPTPYRLDYLDNTQKDMYKAIEKNRLDDRKNSLIKVRVIHILTRLLAQVV